MQLFDKIKEPYVIKFVSKKQLRQTLVSKLPKWCFYQMANAQIIRHYRLLNGQVFSQSYTQSPFFINIIQARSQKQFRIKFGIESHQYLFFILLNGTLELKTTDRNSTKKINANTFNLIRSKKTIFEILMKKGCHSVLIISMKLDWANLVFKGLNAINQIIEIANNSETKFNILPNCRIDNQIFRYINDLFTLPNENFGIIDGLLRTTVTKLLLFYNNLLSKKENDLAQRIKNYLDINFANPEITCHIISKIFYVTERTLRNHFKREFDTTIYEYYTSLRLQKAKYLIESLKEPAINVYMKVGYKDESSFRYAYKKYTGKHPV